MCTCCSTTMCQKNLRPNNRRHQTRLPIDHCLCVIHIRNEFKVWIGEKDGICFWATIMHVNIDVYMKKKGHFLLLCQHAGWFYAVVCTYLVLYARFHRAVTILVFVQNYAAIQMGVCALPGPRFVQR